MKWKIPIKKREAERRSQYSLSAALAFRFSVPFASFEWCCRRMFYIIYFSSFHLFSVFYFFFISFAVLVVSLVHSFLWFKLRAFLFLLYFRCVSDSGFSAFCHVHTHFLSLSFCACILLIVMCTSPLPDLQCDITLRLVSRRLHSSSVQIFLSLVAPRKPFCSHFQILLCIWLAEFPNRSKH